MFKRNSFTTSKILPTILITLVFVSVFSVNSFAYTEYVYIPISDFTIDMYTQEANQGGAITHYNNTIVTRGPVNIGGVTFYGISNSNSNFAGTGKTHNCLVYKLQDLSIKDEYNIKFTTRINAAASYAISVFLTDSNGQYLAVLGYDNRPAVASQVLVTDFNFSLDGLNINTNQGIFLNIETQYGSQYSGNFEFLISAVTLTNLDDDTGFFESIINWIRTVASDITNGVSTLVGSISNLGSNISTWLTSLGNNINTWLTNLKNGIVDKLQNVQTAITSAIDGIEQWFIDLGTEIGNFFTMLKNYILYFQHPVTLNSDGVPVDSNGNPVYTNPFTDTLDSLSDTLNDTFDDLDGFILTIQSVNVQITGYLQTFTTIFNRFNASVPIFAIIIVLAFIIIVIKKIMGR